MGQAMFERILIPLDGSSRAEQILHQVRRILKREESEVLLLRVIEISKALDALAAGRRVDTARLLDQEREVAQSYVHDLIRQFPEKGTKIHARVIEGPPAETILEQAKIEGATLIAMTTHGRSGLSRWFMGSVAEKVVRESPVPVLLVRSFRQTPGGSVEPAAPEEFRFQKILVPTDGSPASLEIVGAAEKLAQLYDSEIVVLHVEMPIILPGTEMGVLPLAVPTPTSEDPVTAFAADRFRHAGLRVERLTVLGDPASEIVDQSHASKIDLVAMSTHGRSGLSRWVMGSVAERVLRHAGVPLLLVRATGKPKKLRTRREGKKASSPAP
jgi:nucleotide-binding universal stress UspA family protein